MRIGVMMRDIAKQVDATGIIILHLMDEILEIDERNEYVLFFQDRAFMDRYAGRPNVRVVRMPSPSKLLWDQVLVPSAARRADVDLLFHPKHSVPLLTGRPTIMHLRGDEYWVYPEHYERMDLLYQRTFLPLFCRKATHLIAESAFTKAGFRRHVGVPEEKLSVVHLAASDRFHGAPGPGAQAAAARRFRLPDRYFLTVTRVRQGRRYYAGKNVPKLLEAFRRSRARGAVKLAIVGSGTREFVRRTLGDGDELRRDLLVLGRVDQRDLPALYARAEAFLFPSKYESFGLPILEAMACGCPVITSNTSACPEVAGGVALLVDPADVADIAAGIDRVAADEELRRDLSARGRERAAHFSWKRAARETVAIFERLRPTVEPRRARRRAAAVSDEDRGRA